MEVLQHEAGIFRPALLRDLALHHCGESGDRHLLIAPRAQSGRRPGPEKLHLRAVLGEGVPGNEEAEDRFFARQALLFGPGGQIGEGSRGGGRGGVFAEQADLARLTLRVPRLSLGERMVQRGDKLCPVAAQ